MKKLFLLSIVLLSQAAAAQFLIWSNSFETADDLQGWTLHDLNNNGNGWVQGKNIYHNGTSMVLGTSGSLRYSISLVPSGTANGFVSENDWIISPEIDLSSAGGNITLGAYVARQRTSQASVARDLYIYVSTPQKPVPALSDFQSLAVDANGNDLPNPYKIKGGYTENPFPSDVTQFVESTVDLTAFAGKKIYIGIWSNRKSTGSNIQNINIDEMAIYATETLNTKEIKKKEILTKIIENPVKENLQLQLNPALKQNITTINIYNGAGQKVVVTQYSKSMNIASLSAGVYIVEVTDGKTTERLNFIKK
ncbi:T9SS C-terminal target domain-containing protein [Chryseobacterium sp. G0186]|uniref:T9SS-dependent choice-of-anchor J family protein n=1 Tax=Chryseobacterium sp. G0186 TaxID=2487064 RepID=UPI000F4DAB9B|nr:choice-of-anchor J domain-containing protein [Chryseobacterium sp. G0186]AZA76191.1 T9SS C-terminal target domain-containing protein [Chryseobacterium sp. G0186]